MGSRYDEYQRQADECVEMSRKSLNEERCSSWLKLAGEWLRMIPPDHDQTSEQRFREDVRASGTGQMNSTASH